MRQLFDIILSIVFISVLCCGAWADDAHVVQVVLEAEDAIALRPPYALVTNPPPGADRAVRIPAVTRMQIARAPTLEYTFELATPERLHVWLRAWWKDSCSNSATVSLNRRPPATVGNDSIYRRWHWVRGPMVHARAGRQTFKLRAREPNAVFDQIVLTNQPTFVPKGPLGRKPVPSPSAVSSSDLAEMSVKPPAESHFMVGIAGDYAVAWEAPLIHLGLPFRRVPPSACWSPDTLAEYDVLCVTAPVDARFLRVLERYVDGGGTLIVESLSYQRIGSAFRVFGRNAFRPLLKYTMTGWKPSPHVTVEANGSPLFASLSGQQPFAYQLLADSLPLTMPGSDVAIHGKVTAHGQTAGALATGPFGRGRFYILGVTFGFSSIRGTAYQAVNEAILIDAVAGRYRPAFAGVQHREQPLGDVFFQDDFMRTVDDGHGWSADGGEWTMSGETGTTPFVLHGRSSAPALIEPTDASWTSPRIGASVRVAGGDGGIWLAAADGRQAQLRLVDDGTLHLVTAHDGVEQSETTTIAVPRAGWRRISLMVEAKHWVASIDGRRSLRLPAPPSAVTGLLRGGLRVHGDASFDDVSVCSTASLVPGSDRAPGEEGASRCYAQLRQGLEFRTIYEPYFDLRPTHQRANTQQFRLPLPIYQPAVVYGNGHPIGRVTSQGTAPTIALDATVPATQTLEIVAHGYRDYLFAGQLIDWYATGRPWHRQNRWACDPSWFWLGVDAQSAPSVLWHRRTLQAPYAFRLLVAETQRRDTVQMEKGRDLNLVIGGNGTDLNDGLLFRLPQAGRGAHLYKSGRLIAENRRFQPYTGHKLHHTWIELVAIVEPKQVRIYYDGTLVIEQRLASTTTGQIGFWTQDNGVQIARATISESLPTLSPSR